LDDVADENEEDEYIDLNHHLKDERLMSSQALELGAVVLKSKPSEKKSGT
jgi:hypothetical protein